MILITIVGHGPTSMKNGRTTASSLRHYRKILKHFPNVMLVRMTVKQN